MVPLNRGAKITKLFYYAQFTINLPHSLLSPSGESVSFHNSQLYHFYPLHPVSPSFGGVGEALKL